MMLAYTSYYTANELLYRNVIHYPLSFETSGSSVGFCVMTSKKELTAEVRPSPKVSAIALAAFRDLFELFAILCCRNTVQESCLFVQDFFYLCGSSGCTSL